VRESSNFIQAKSNFFHKKGVCDGFGDPQYLTYDRVNYTFNGNCSYIASRDVSKNGEHQFEIFVTNVECVDEPGTTCTEGVTVLHQGHVVNMRRLEGQKKVK
jgi:von Willebrand factor type D domain